MEREALRGGNTPAGPFAPHVPREHRRFTSHYSWPHSRLSIVASLGDAAPIILTRHKVMTTHRVPLTARSSARERAHLELLDAGNAPIL